MTRRGPALAAAVSGRALTVVFALGVAMLVVAATGQSPAATIDALAAGAFGGVGQTAETLSLAVPLALVAFGWLLAFRGGRINIGLEGQMIVGGIGAAAVGVHLTHLAGPLHLALVTLASAAAGGAWAFIAASFWARRGVSEVISTLLLNFVALQLLSWVVHGPLQEPTHTIPSSAPIGASARWPELLPDTALTADVVLVAAVAAGIVLLPRTAFGLRLRYTGLNPEAARYAGIATTRISATGLVVSGALAGLAGGCMVVGTDVTTLSEGFSANIGFTGIVVALLARNGPVASLVTTIMIAALLTGSDYTEATVGVPSSVALIIEATLILAISLADSRRFRRGRRSSVSRSAP